jgi:biopolymer transport protein ExbD
MKYAFVIIASIALAGCASIGTQEKVDMVKISADGTTYLNGQKTPVASLSESFTCDAVTITADRATSYKNITAALDEIKEAGIIKVTLFTEDNSKK